jgi:hypothetical protein
MRRHYERAQLARWPALADPLQHLLPVLAARLDDAEDIAPGGDVRARSAAVCAALCVRGDGGGGDDGDGDDAAQEGGEGDGDAAQATPEELLTRVASWLRQLCRGVVLSALDTAAAAAVAAAATAAAGAAAEARPAHNNAASPPPRPRTVPAFPELALQRGVAGARVAAALLAAGVAPSSAGVGAGGGAGAPLADVAALASEAAAAAHVLDASADDEGAALRAQCGEALRGVVAAAAAVRGSAAGG